LQFRSSSSTAGAGTNSALDFAPEIAGTTENAYISVGNPAKLRLPTFTVVHGASQCPPGLWTIGSFAIPLMTKGQEVNAMSAQRHWNSVPGILNNVLFADLEEGAAGSSPELNHPVTGIIPAERG
jgi:hypothetical protein